MSSMYDRRAEDAVTAALENKIVLRRIFCCLPLSDLKQCRLVKRTWNSEAASFIRDFRVCHCRISKNPPCSDLLALADAVWRMDIVPMNSFSIELDEPGHSDCMAFTENHHKLYENLLQVIPVKHLHISWDNAFSPLSCPAVNFVVDLLRRKIMELSTLQLTRLPTEFLAYFGQVWVPWFPKLTMLEMGETRLVSNEREFFLRIIGGAPNLTALKGIAFNAETLDFIPNEKYALLKEFTLFMLTERHERNCLKLAEAGPALTHFCLAACSEVGEYMRSLISVTGKLLSSSCKTLETLIVHPQIFPLLNLFTFPRMINVRTIDIFATNTSPQLLHVLRAIDFPKLFPVLSEVSVDVKSVFDPNNPVPNPWANEEGAQVVPVNPSTTVKSLDITAEFDLLTVVEVSRIFPNTVKLVLWGDIGQPTNLAFSALYRDVWASWPYLESVSLGEHGAALRWNFDAEFLGINSEEVEILRQLDDDSLEKINIVPVRSSLLTLSGLRKFEFESEADPPPVEVVPDQVFLSKLTGLLAFKKMAEQGVQIQFVLKNPQAALRLNHISPFVNFVCEF